MKIQSAFDELANKSASRYQFFLQNISNAYNRTILNKTLNVRTNNEFKNDLDNYARDYLEAETNYINDNYEFIFTQLTEKSENKLLEEDEWVEYLNQNTQFLYDAIKLQVQKDILFASNFMRNQIIHIMSLNDYEAAHKLITNAKELSFFYTDKIGRKVNSVKYIRTITRSYLVSNYNELLVVDAMISGKDTIQVEHLDQKHKHNELILSINENENHLNYFQNKDEIFHPNSNAIVRL